MSKYITLPGLPLGVGYSHCVVTEPSQEQQDRGYEFGEVLCSCPDEEKALQITSALNAVSARNIEMKISVTDIESFRGLVNALADNADQLPEPVVEKLNEILAEGY